MLTENDASSRRRRDPWNKSRLIGQKRASRGHGVIVNSGSTVARRLMAEMRILIRAG
jgi:hypothetical protein